MRLGSISSENTPPPPRARFIDTDKGMNQYKVMRDPLTKQIKDKQKVQGKMNLPTTTQQQD
jgi:hypothetical protein